MTEAYFFDTYAVLEIMAGNKNYMKYADAEIMLTKLNLFEVFYAILRESGGKAKDYLEASVALSPSISAYQQLGAVLEKLNEKDAALECYKKGLLLWTESLNHFR